MRGAVVPVPDPALVPTVSIEEAGRWFGLGRSAAYSAAARGELPVLRFNGHSLRVPVAPVRVMLGLPVNDEPARVSDESAASCDRAVTGPESRLCGPERPATLSPSDRPAERAT